MTTREEIEAAAKRRQKWNDAGQPNNSYDVGECPYDADVLADAYLSERQQRERDQQPPTREMFLGLPFHMSLRWNMSLTFPVLNPDYPLETIAKLRAACLLLGIETEGVL